MSAAGLAVFVKTPGFSPLKTRLWPALGQTRAETFHLASAAAVASVVDAACALQSGLRAYWAVAESSALEATPWSGWPRLWQGDGDLGARMRSIHAELIARHGRAVLLGADTPQLEIRHLLEALRCLDSEQARTVIGPASDGGFWLFGSNHRLPAAAWTEVSYSQSQTARDFLALMAPAGDTHVLPTLQDADEYADLPEIRDALERLAAPTPAQRAVHTLLAATTTPC